MMSRFLKPISKSITTVLCPNSARPDDIAAEEVVLPTPPLPDVITIILAKAEPFLLFFFDSTQYLTNSLHVYDLIIQDVKNFNSNKI